MAKRTWRERDRMRCERRAPLTKNLEPTKCFALLRDRLYRAALTHGIALTKAPSIFIIVHDTIGPRYGRGRAVSPAHMDSQPIRAGILPFTTVDRTGIPNFGPAGSCASLSLEVTRQVSECVYTCEDSTATIRTEYAILGIDLGTL
jgi:hypothetical protein